MLSMTHFENFVFYLKWHHDNSEKEVENAVLFIYIDFVLLYILSYVSPISMNYILKMKSLLSRTLYLKWISLRSWLYILEILVIIYWNGSFYCYDYVERTKLFIYDFKSYSIEICGSDMQLTRTVPGFFIHGGDIQPRRMEKTDEIIIFRLVDLEEELLSHFFVIKTASKLLKERNTKKEWKGCSSRGAFLGMLHYITGAPFVGAFNNTCLNSFVRNKYKYYRLIFYIMCYYCWL